MKLKNKVIITAISLNQAVMTSAFAATDTSQIDGVYNWLLDWSKKVGVGIIIWGGISIALAYKSEDSHAMEKGIKTLVAGFMVTGIDVLVRQFM